MESSSFFLALLALQVVLVPIGRVNSEAVQVTSSTYEEYRKSKDILLLNFYADWCRFSQMLRPIYDKAADQLHAQNDRVLVGKINCDTDRELCSNPFHVTKYPTLKIVRYGMIARKEYRGQRTVEAITNFVQEQLKDPVQTISNLDEMVTKDNKNSFLGYFPSTTTNHYLTYMRVAIGLKDDCAFYAYLGGDDSLSQIVFREEGRQDAIFTGKMDDISEIFTWVYEHCIPLVREITFQNGEEMTEEGLPLLILFYHPDDTSVKEIFRQKVETELKEHRGSVNCVTANGIHFAHPLHHLGKHKHDLPVLAIDSFRHMYLFPNFNDIHVQGKLYQFISDLHSGKLHKDFHNPPPPTPQDQDTQSPTKDQEKRAAPPAPQSPPESSFKKLAPGKSRYSFRDEL